jgi:hypothetical protein
MIRKLLLLLSLSLAMDPSAHAGLTSDEIHAMAQVLVESVQDNSPIDPAIEMVRGRIEDSDIEMVVAALIKISGGSDNIGLIVHALIVAMNHESDEDTARTIRWIANRLAVEYFRRVQLPQQMSQSSGKFAPSQLPGGPRPANFNEPRSDGEAEMFREYAVLVEGMMAGRSAGFSNTGRDGTNLPGQEIDECSSWLGQSPGKQVRKSQSGNGAQSRCDEYNAIMYPLRGMIARMPQLDQEDVNRLHSALRRAVNDTIPVMMMRSIMGGKCGQSKAMRVVGLLNSFARQDDGNYQDQILHFLSRI